MATETYHEKRVSGTAWTLQAPGSTIEAEFVVRDDPQHAKAGFVYVAFWDQGSAISFSWVLFQHIKGIKWNMTPVINSGTIHPMSHYQAITKVGSKRFDFTFMAPTDGTPQKYALDTENYMSIVSARGLWTLLKENGWDMLRKPSVALDAFSAD